MSQPILIPKGSTVTCGVYGTNRGKVTYACTLPDGKFKEVELLTIWDPKVVEISDNGIRIKAKKDMRCDFSPSRGSLKNELFCPSTI